MKERKIQTNVQIVFLGFSFNKGKCIMNHPIKAQYITRTEDELIFLIHPNFISHIKEMILDDTRIIPNHKYVINKPGIHTIYYSLDNELEYLGEMFYGVENLTSIIFTQLFNTENVTNMNFMFWGCKQLKSIDLSYFKTDNIDNMSGMFQGCSELMSLNLSSFNTQNVTSISSMFYGCSSLKSINISHFNTEELTGMRNMFY